MANDDDRIEVRSDVGALVSLTNLVRQTRIGLSARSAPKEVQQALAVLANECRLLEREVEEISYHIGGESERCL